VAVEQIQGERCSGDGLWSPVYKPTKLKPDICIEHDFVCRYRVVREGAAEAARPSMNSPCDCHYRGALIDGREFDSSYARGAPATFTPSEVIKGWCEALLLMKEGDVWQLYVPSELAYGDCSRSLFWRGACVSPLTVCAGAVSSLPAQFSCLILSC
jgi:hypothetical protein